jgi:hypothetical protein
VLVLGFSTMVLWINEFRAFLTGYCSLMSKQVFSNLGILYWLIAIFETGDYLLISKSRSMCVVRTQDMFIVLP